MEQETAADDLHDLFADHWEHELRESPVMASIYYGDRRYDDQLPGAQVADFTRRLDALRGFQQRLRQIDGAELGPADQLNGDLLG